MSYNTEHLIKIDNLKNLAQQVNARITALNTRTQILTNDTFGYKNSVYRGQYLGDAVTDAQYEAIKAKNYADFYIGDYWIINGRRYTVAKFWSNMGVTVDGTTSYVNSMIIIVGGGLYPMNDTEGTSGGFQNTTMYNETLPLIEETIVDPDFRNLAIKHNDFVDVGAVHGRRGWYVGGNKNKVSLLRFEMIFGYLYPYYDTYCYQFHKTIFPVFLYDTDAVFNALGRSDSELCWVSSRFDLDTWCVVGRFGYASVHGSGFHLNSAHHHALVYFCV